MDLGAEYVYPESAGCIYDLEWPYALMEDEHYQWEDSMTYDSSGLRICSDMERKLTNILQYHVVNIPILLNPKKSVGQYIENA